MPFVANDEEDEQQPNTAQGPVSPGGGGVHLAPSAGVGSLSAPGAGSTNGGSGVAQKDSGGQFASINQYLSANQGQAQPIANKITDQANQQYNSLDQGNQSVLQNLQGQVSGGYTANDPNLLAQEAANPVAFASNGQNVTNFQKLLNDQYTGPQSAEGDAGYQKQQAAVNSAISQGQAQTQTQAGQQGLVQQLSAVPTQSVGALNTAILTNDPTALGQVQNAYVPFQNLVSGLTNGATTVDKAIAQGQSDANTANQAANRAITGQQATLNNAVTGATTTAQNQAAAQEAAVNNELANLYGGTAIDTTGTTLGTYGGGSTPWVNTTNYSVNNLTPQTAAALGLNATQAAQLQAALAQAATSQYMSGHNFGVGSGTTQIDLSNFLTQADPTQAITTANIATPEQYAQQQAFQTLLGQLPSGAVLDPTQVALAGTAPANLNTFNYNNALATAQQTAAAERQAAQDAANAISGAADVAHAQSQHGGGILGALGKAANVVFPVATVANKLAIPAAQKAVGAIGGALAHGGVVEGTDERFKRLLETLGA